MAIPYIVGIYIYIAMETERINGAYLRGGKKSPSAKTDIWATEKKRVENQNTYVKVCFIYFYTPTSKQKRNTSPLAVEKKERKKHI